MIAREFQGLFFFLVFTSEVYHVCSQSSLCGVAETNETLVLSTLKSELRMDGLWNEADWREWKGVVWNEDGRVESITLVNKSLNGTLRSIWNELPSLAFLDLSHNHIRALNLSGCQNKVLKTLNLSSNRLPQVPHGLSELIGLENLNLSVNVLRGPVPNFTALKYLNLSSNNFSGSLSFGSHPALEVLDVSHNKFSGDVPVDAFQRFDTLKVVNLSNNALEGRVEKMFGQLTSLVRLVLSDNHFVGGLPDDLENCTSLFQLDFTQNNFSGVIPPSLGKLPVLSVLSAGSNNLSGELHFEAGTFQKLRALYLIRNKFSGRLSSSIGNMRSLRLLYLGNNAFEGPIPAEFGNCTQLNELWLNNNDFTAFPEELFMLPELSQLVLNNNQLSGQIPDGLGNFTKLKVLWLENNNFAGELPAGLGNLTSLVMLSVASNHLTGTVPPTYRNLKKLKGLDVGSNSMSGPVPDCLFELTALEFLFMARNNFSGTFPAALTNLAYLQALDLSYNKLTGSIPPGIAGFFKMVEFYRYTLETAYVHSDHLTYIYGFGLPTTIDLSHNNLNGSIPAEIGNMLKLQQLDLSWNELTGSIPPSLGSATNLFKVNLSYNQLTGAIPENMSRLTFLSSLDLSYNKLEGKIPDAVPISNFSPSNFEGNAGLCGPPLLVKCGREPSSMSPQNSMSSQSSSRFRRILPVFVTVCAVFLCGLVLAMYFALARRRQKLYSNGEGCCERNVNFSMTFSEKLPEHILPEKLAAATNNYSQMNIVGDGGFGVVYRAVLESGAVVAVKKLTSGGLQGDREFHAELQTLGELNHRNLVPLLGYCSDGNERLLIYKYLKNGSLDTWLYCREPGMKPLDWPTRLRVARGAAQGIAYLHQGGDHSSIIHRDIKVSNILLDEEFEAHVADFGLARLVRQGDTHVSTDVAGTIGYIPPEYNHKCFATPKGDVYSFGVVCMEILTAKRPTDQFFRKTGAGHLVAWIQSLRSLDEFKSALDPCLLLACEESRVMEQMAEMIRIACCCCRDAPSKRPSMQEVASFLEKLEKICLMSARCSTDQVEQLKT